eukprot:COSAG02_NODE_409_length_22892_cov_11.461150_18_plen_74_part_00
MQGESIGCATAHDTPPVATGDVPMPRIELDLIGARFTVSIEQHHLVMTGTHTVVRNECESSRREGSPTSHKDF